MAEEQAADNTQANPTSPVPTGLPINWGLITGPVPEPVFPQSSTVFVLQPENKGRGRPATVEQISSDVPLRPRPKGKGQSSWRTGACKDLSSSDEEEEEVEVQVQLEIHSPPAEAKAENDKDKTNNEDSPAFFYTGKPYGLGEGTSQESLLSDNSNSSKDVPPPPPPQQLVPSSVTTSATTSPSTASSSTRRWAPPKGFWRVARPETLLLNGVGPHDMPSSLPVIDYTQIQDSLIKTKTYEAEKRHDKNIPVSVDDTSTEIKPSGSVECCLDGYEQKLVNTAESETNINAMASQSLLRSAEDKETVKDRAYSKLRERQKYLNEDREERGGESENTPLRFNYQATVVHEVMDVSDSAILAQDLEPYLRSLLVISDELPLSPRHEQAKRLLERARLKARSINADCPGRRSHSDQLSTIKKQSTRSPSPPASLKMVQPIEDLPVQAASAPVIIPAQRDTSPTDQAGRYKHYGCSPTRVRFEDESEKEAESRYLDRMRQRGRPGMPKSKMNDMSTDSSSSSSERSRSHRNVSMSLRQEDPAGAHSEINTVVKEIVVLVKKCESCGSVVRVPQPVSLAPEPQNTEQQLSGNPEDPRLKTAVRGANPHKSEASTRPKAPLTVTFAGAFVLGENKESSTGWKPSGFGKLRRRSRKGESRLESGHGPYGPSWAQRRNSNPRNRISMSRGVSFAPDSPVALEPRLLEASSGLKDSSTPSLPIKSALKSSSRNRSATSQPTVQFQMDSNQGEGGSPSDLDPQETKRESPLTLTQGTPTTSSLVSCIRPSTLRYTTARPTTDLPTAEIWDTASDGLGLTGDVTTASEGRALRGLAMFRAEDLRADLLRAEHLKAEVTWENTEGYRKLDGRPKLFLRRFFSSIGLNSVGRLVKGGRSSSMEQLSLPAVTRASSASPSPTRRPQQSNRLQRTPSLQSLHTVLPLAQLRKAASVQSLERRTERSTILGEVQIPYGLAPSPDSPRHELHRALSVENVLVSRLGRPVGRVTQAFPDGTLLLELIKPPHGPFGFVISRGKGRPDTGVYIEKVGDGSSEGPYLGLLSVGDEILQVNGEVVAGLTLDQVTRLMTREITASLRIMPARRSQR
ncbi:uncharacterized protein si:ch211-13f8.1 [Gouania willdenowi]|uniref:uncharacterized protein si:ch211-13f8.1 n=1 Tax=Gouania willdenowi TaxID=441366 RepID=UPI0010544FC6|nr:uncharacterized protein KIAA1614 homolog [Gouania willdenowi]